MKKNDSFENTHNINKLQHNKVFPILVSVFAMVVVVLGAVWYISWHSEKNKEIDIDYKDYTTVTAKEGKEYTTTDANGNIYSVEKDGMYCLTDFGKVKVLYNKPLNKFNTYRYELYSGTTCEFTLNKDGTYDYTQRYSDGSYTVFNGKYDISVGVNDVFRKANIKSQDEFNEAFLCDVAAINPNDLFAVDLNYGTSKEYDENGKEITSPNESYDEIEDDESDQAVTANSRPIDVLAIYIYKDNNNQFKAVAYDISEQMLFNSNHVNGKFSVDYKGGE